MRSTTRMALVPDCLRTISTTALLPLTVAADSTSAMLSSMRATSRTRIGVPLTVATGMAPNSFGGGHAAVGAQREIAQTLLDLAAGDLDVLRLQRGHDLRSRQTLSR